MTELENQIIQLKADLERADAQAGELQRQHEAQLRQLEEKYEARLGQVQQDLQRSKELMLWDKATLETTQTALEQARSELHERDTAVTQLQKELQARQSELESVYTQLARHQAAEAELTQSLEAQAVKLAEQETAAAQLRQEIASFQNSISQLEQTAGASKEQFAQAQEQAILEAAELRERLRETRTQLEAQEAETENYYQQMQKQGKRLAEIQATLVERELVLGQLKETAEKQKALISRIKEVTSERMNKLNGELSETRQQLKQAIAMVHKLRKSGN
jgi:chromosome segregation ATPase